MKHFRLILFVSLVWGLFTACDRQEREQAGLPKSDVVTPAESTVQLAYATKPEGSVVVSAVMPKSDAGGPDGAAIYGRVCAACHQGTGQGVPGAFPPLLDSHYVIGNNVERMAAIMVYGLAGPMKVNGVNYTGAMPGQGEVLSDAELAAVATYVRSAWTHKAGPVEIGVFQKVRAKYGKRGPFAIQELGEE